jgi:hypothetical protein
MMRIQSDCYESRPTRLAPSASIPDPQPNPAVQVFPNPFSDVIHISSGAELQKIALYQADGKLIYTSELKDLEFSLETSFLRKGMYLLQVTTAKGVEIVNVVK